VETKSQIQIGSSYVLVDVRNERKVYMQKLSFEVQHVSSLVYVVEFMFMTEARMKAPRLRCVQRLESDSFKW